MSLAQGFEVTVAPSTWTLIAQSPAGNGVLVYNGLNGLSPVDTRFRTYVGLTQVANPDSAHYRHGYITSPSDRTAMVIDKAEIYTTNQFVFLEAWHEDAAPQAVSGALLGG